METKTKYLAKHRDHLKIRQQGAIGHLNEGIEILLHGIPTRLIAWPGNGYQTESVHVQTLKPGLESGQYNYPLSEESFLCVQGRGEVYLRGRWISLEPGDMAYFPENIPHAIRNDSQNQEDFIVVNSLTPPMISLYIDSGFYIKSLGKMDFDAVEAAKSLIVPGKIKPENQMQYRETHPEVRAWNLNAEDIRKQGALFNVFRGATLRYIMGRFCVTAAG